MVVHEGFDVDAVDATGAGDAFAAGFLAAHFDRDLQTALAVGNACGAIATGTMGARTRLTWAAVESYLG
jgi:ribokinase